MNFEKFKKCFHESWHDKIRPFIESEECDDIYKFLKHESRRGKRIAPLSDNVYRCFLETPLDTLKVVMLGMCPYHTLRNDSPIADGLLMGCSTTNYAQPSLQKFYDAVEVDVYGGVSLEGFKNPDVSFLANQGVLMLNTALTTEINKAGSHIALWHPFTKYVFENILSIENVPTIYLGKDASKFIKYTAPLSWNFVLSHPASAAYKNTEWDTEGVFTKVNTLLKDYNDTTIEWLDFEPFK